jgi:exosortase
MMVAETSRGASLTVSARTALFAAFCVCLALANLPILRELYYYSRDNVAASHVVLIPFVSAMLMFQDRASIFSSVRTSWGPGLLFLVMGAGLSIAGRTHLAGGDFESLTWMVAATVACAIGGFVLVYGRDASRAAMFPLAFLVFMVPIPDGLLNAATLLLKRGSSETVAGLFWLTGTPFHRDGFVFTLPNLVIEIADECSGIRSSIALLLTVLIAGHMFLRSPVNKLLLVLAIVPIAILKNAIRIVALSLLTIHVNREFMVGRLHHEGGIVFFLMALAVLSPLFSLLRNRELRRTVSLDGGVSGRHRN